MRMKWRSLLLGIAAILMVGAMGVLVLREREARRLKAEEEAGELAAGGGVPREDKVPAGAEEVEKTIPEQAREMMDEAMAVPDMGQRSKRAAFIIRDLCGLGHPKEAWDLIDARPGQVRASQILIFFHNAKLPPVAMLAKVKELQGGGEKVKALETYFSAMPLEEILLAMEEPEALKAYKELEAAAPEEVTPVLARMMREKQLHSRSDAVTRQVADFARAMYRLTAIDGSVLMMVLLGDTSRNAFERWTEAVDELKAEPKLYVEDPNRARLIDGMLREDAGKAMTVLTAGDSPQALVDLALAVRIWRGFDKSESGEWMKEKAAGLEGTRRDVVMAELSRIARRAGNAEEAAAWAEKVGDARLKAELLEGK